jgi:EVE domain
MDFLGRPSCWLFQANPDKYRIAERLIQKPAIMTWIVKQHLKRVKEGETAFVYQCKGKPTRYGKNNSGICAVMQVLCDPVVMTDLPFEEEYYINKEFFAGTKTRVICAIRSTGWLEDGDIGDLQLLKGKTRTKTVFDLTPSEAKRLHQLTSKWSPPFFSRQ